MMTTKQQIYVLLISCMYQLNAENVHERDAKTVINHLVDSFFDNNEYPGKELCRNNAYNSLHKCINGYVGDRPVFNRECIKQKTLAHISGNIVQMSAERARNYIKRFNFSSDLEEQVISKIMGHIKQELANVKQDVRRGYARFLGNNPNLDYKVNEVVNFYGQQTIIALQTVHQKNVCCQDDDHWAHLIRLSCGHYICHSCAVEWDAHCKNTGNGFICPAGGCGTYVDSPALQTNIYGPSIGSWLPWWLGGK